jgi:hypothetical protein
MNYGKKIKSKRKKKKSKGVKKVISPSRRLAQIVKDEESWYPQDGGES